MPTQTYMPAIPEVAKAYQNDPRTQLALAAMQQGTSTSPVAQGKYAWADGIARALQAGLGGYMQKRQERKYNEKEQSVMDKVAAALGGGEAAAQQGGGAVLPPQGVQGAGGASPAQAQLPPQAMVPPPPQNNPAPMPPPQAAPAAPQGAPVDPAAGMAPPPPQAAPAAPQGGAGGFDALGQGAPAQPVPGRTYNVADAVAELGMSPEAAQAQYGGPGHAGGAVHSAVAQALAGGGGNPAAPFAPRSSGVQLINAMLPITRSTESNGRDFKADGSVVTSNKGARFAMQVMPATARKPGFGITPARDDSPEEYNRVGTELLQKLTDKYGDPAKAWAAYNAGSGRLEHAIAKHGDQWLANMPTETQKYVAKNMAALGGQGDTQQAAAADGPVPAAALAAQNAHAPDPAMPDMPTRPQDRMANKSLRLAAGRSLLNTRDPFLYQQAMAMLDNGMGEQFDADSKALAEANKRDDTGYESGLNDFTNARSQQRAAGFQAQQDERTFGHEDRTLAATQQFQREEGATNDAFTAKQNELNRQAQRDLTQMQIDGKKDVASIRAQRMQNFLQTPQGSKMYSAANDAIQKNDNIVASIDNFMEVNKDHETGGLILNSPIGGMYRVTHPSVQQMDSLVHNLAPQLRAAGQGSMSDRDLKLFEQSIPNTGMPYETNQKRAVQFKAFVGRMNDFEINKVQAASEGTGVNFMRDWSTYRNSVPVLNKDGTPGMSFDDWKASIPQYDAKGNRK
jgi:hypothetical protein